MLLYRRFKEIERADRFEFTPLLVENSGDRTGLGDSETGAQPLDGFDQLLVFFPPVEPRPEPLPLPGIQAPRLQDMGRAAGTAHVLAQTLQAFPTHRVVRP